MSSTHQHNHQQINMHQHNHQHGHTAIHQHINTSTHCHQHINTIINTSTDQHGNASMQSSTWPVHQHMISEKKMLFNSEEKKNTFPTENFSSLGSKSLIDFFLSMFRSRFSMQKAGKVSHVWVLKPPLLGFWWTPRFGLNFWCSIRLCIKSVATTNFQWFLRFSSESPSNFWFREWQEKTLFYHSKIGISKKTVFCMKKFIIFPKFFKFLPKNTTFTIFFMWDKNL